MSFSPADRALIDRVLPSQYYRRPAPLFNYAAVAELLAEARREGADDAMPSPYCEVCGSCGSDGCGCEHKCVYSLSHPDVVAEMDRLSSELAVYREYFEAREYITQNGVLNATDEALSRVGHATAAARALSQASGEAA